MEGRSPEDCKIAQKKERLKSTEGVLVSGAGELGLPCKKSLM